MLRFIKMAPAFNFFIHPFEHELDFKSPSIFASDTFCALEDPILRSLLSSATRFVVEYFLFCTFGAKPSTSDILNLSHVCNPSALISSELSSHKHAHPNFDFFCQTCFHSYTICLLKLNWSAIGVFHKVLSATLSSPYTAFLNHRIVCPMYSLNNWPSLFCFC